VCDCNYFVCVLATRSFVWLQDLTVSVWLKSYLVIWYMIASLGSVWLQKNSRFVCDCKPYFVCDIANTNGYVLRLQKKTRTGPVCDYNYFACVIATRSYMWLQTPDCLCGWNCKPGGRVWLQKLFCVCDCNYFTCVIAAKSYLWLQNLTVSVWLKSTWLFGIWLQDWVVCDCKTAGSFVIAKPILCG
jgi:hypothetical protein